MGVTMVVEEVEVEVAAVWSELTVVLEPTVSVDFMDMSEVTEVVDVLDRDLSILDGGRTWQPMEAKLMGEEWVPSLSGALRHSGLEVLITGAGLWGPGDGVPV